jgi:hypothetical protein
MGNSSSEVRIFPPLRTQAEAAEDALPKTFDWIERLHKGIEEICQQRLTPPKTRMQLRLLVAGLDWRKAK